MAIVDKLKAIGDAIREKTGGTAKLSLDQMVDEIEGISTGGGGDSTEIEDAFINRSFETYTNTRATSIGDNAFNTMRLLKTVYLPNATSLGMYAFKGCSLLKEIDLSKVTNIGNYCFDGCSSLLNASAPLITELKNYTFNGCGKMETLSAPNVTKIGGNAFAGCWALTKVEFPLLTSLDPSAFTNTKALTAFIIRTPDTVATMVNAYGGSGSAIVTGTGYFYVPDDLVEDYKVATNWTKFANQIKPLSEYVEVTE